MVNSMISRGVYAYYGDSSPKSTEEEEKKEQAIDTTTTNTSTKTNDNPSQENNGKRRPSDGLRSVLSPTPSKMAVSLSDCEITEQIEESNTLASPDHRLDNELFVMETSAKGDEAPEPKTRFCLPSGDFESAVDNDDDAVAAAKINASYNNTTLQPPGALARFGKPQQYDGGSGLVMPRSTPMSQVLMEKSASVERKDREKAFSYMGGSLAARAPIHRRLTYRLHDAFHLTPMKKFWLIFFVLPTLAALWYASAILFPPSWYDDCRFLVWTPSAQNRTDDGEFVICPRESICSEGTFQVILISVARLTAFASYVVQGLVFTSKMHSSIHFLSDTYAATIIPFESLHHVHAFTGSTYAVLIFLHTLAHFIRWGVRKELAHWCGQVVGLSGIFGALAMGAVVFVMSPWGKKVVVGVGKNKRKLTFENRFLSHQISFWVLTIALCFHVKRTRQITLSYFILWLLDYTYGWIFRTHRLDVVEFTGITESCGTQCAGTQMLWKNPKGFSTKSGEFVRVRIPWLDHGGNEWHPFSIYLKEATKEGMEEVLRQERKKSGRIFVGEESKGGREIDPSKTAVLLIEFQNEFVHPNGGLYENVKGVLESTSAIENVKELADEARKAGVRVIHAPITVKNNGSDNPNSGLGILKNVRNGRYFEEGTWNAEICDELKPKLGDLIVEGKHGLDCFPGSNLEEILVELGIETLILAGLLTNCCVESTMRTAYEKGLNTITLVDGTACNSRAEQIAACNTTFKMFSTPMKCEEVIDIFKGNLPNRKSNLRTSTFQTKICREGGGVTMQSIVSESGIDGEILDAEKTLEEFADDVLSHPYTESDDAATIARQGLNKNDTTQVFIMPAGDWTKGLAKQSEGRDHMRSCWVKGPYTSPYFVASDFSHSVLMASGIGITPALGVMGQFPGASKTKILVWSVRSKNMLKFFAPLLKDAHLAAIFYTGKDKLSIKELKRVRSHGNIFVQQSRPTSLIETIASLIVLFERSFVSSAVFSKREWDDEKVERSLVDMNATEDSGPALQTIRTMKDLPLEVRRTWVLLYCGGSLRIRDELAAFAKKTKIGWQAELFDW